MEHNISVIKIWQSEEQTADVCALQLIHPAKTVQTLNTKLKLKARIYEKRRKSLSPKSGTIEPPFKNTNNSEHLKSKTTLYSVKFRIWKKNHCVQDRTIYNIIYIRANVNKTTRKSAWRKYKWIKMKLTDIHTHVHTQWLTGTCHTSPQIFTIPENLHILRDLDRIYVRTELNRPFPYTWDMNMWTCTGLTGHHRVTGQHGQKRHTVEIRPNPNLKAHTGLVEGNIFMPGKIKEIMI